MKRLFAIMAVMLTMIVLSGQAFASISFHDTYGSTVTFAQSGGNLIVTLVDGRIAMSGGQELTSVFFNLSGVGTLTPVSAILPAGTTVWNASGASVALPAGNNVGKEWQYKPTINAFGTTRSGIGSAGIGIFGQSNFGSTSEPVNGGDWGLTNGYTGFSVNNSPLVHNSVVFTLSGAGGFDPNNTNVTNVSFYYGTTTATNYGTPGIVPIPAAAWLLGSGLVGLVVIHRRFKK